MLLLVSAETPSLAPVTLSIVDVRQLLGRVWEGCLGLSLLVTVITCCWWTAVEVYLIVRRHVVNGYGMKNKVGREK